MVTNKTILITGANRGIGLGILKELAAQGHTIFASYRNPSSADTLQQIADKYPNQIHLIQLDVSDQNSIELARKEVTQRTNHLDVLINNAGIFSEAQGCMDANMDEVKMVMETNFYGPWRMSRTFYPLLSESNDARIVHMSSGMGAHAELHANHAAYRLSKAALNDLTILMNNELENVKVNAMSPGWVRTDMGGANADRSVEEGADTAVWLATSDHIGSGKFYRDRKELEW